MKRNNGDEKVKPGKRVGFVNQYIAENGSLRFSVVLKVPWVSSGLIGPTMYTF